MHKKLHFDMDSRFFFFFLFYSYSWVSSRATNKLQNNIGGFWGRERGGVGEEADFNFVLCSWREERSLNCVSSMDLSITFYSNSRDREREREEGSLALMNNCLKNKRQSKGWWGNDNHLPLLKYVCIFTLWSRS